MSKVVLFGCGRGADIAYRYLKRDTDHEICAFTVDAQYKKNETFHDLPLVDFEEVEKQYPPDEYSMFILLGYQGMNHLRAQKYQTAKDKGYSFINYINPEVYSPEPLNIGENCFLMERQCVNLDVKIGHNVVMWSCNHIGDETVIGDHVWFSSHITIAGNVTVGDYSFLGINASISNFVSLGAETFVGASAFISENTKPGSVYVQPAAKCIANDSKTFMKVLEVSKKL